MFDIKNRKFHELFFERNLIRNIEGCQDFEQDFIDTICVGEPDGAGVVSQGVPSRHDQDQQEPLQLIEIYRQYKTQVVLLIYS